MRTLLALAIATIITAGLSAEHPTRAGIERAVTRPAAEAHVVMTPPPDLFGSMLIAR